MSKRTVKVGLIGATGAVGRELVKLLAPFEEVELVPIASMACTIPRIRFREDQVLVRNLDVETIEQCDLLIFSMPKDVALKWAPKVIDLDIPIIDLTGVIPKPLIAASVNPEDLADFREYRAVGTVRPLASAVSTLLYPLRTFIGISHITITAMHAASVRGREGVEELSKQVVALFNSRNPERKIFPGGLAFDVVPTLSGSGDWSKEEQKTAEQIEQLLSLESQSVAVTSVIAPWFNGLCFSVHVLTDRYISVTQIEQILKSAPSVELWEEEHLGARTSDGTLTVNVSRIREDPGGQGFHLWAGIDEILFGAAGNAAAILKIMLEDELI